MGRRRLLQHVHREEHVEIEMLEKDWHVVFRGPAWQLDDTHLSTEGLARYRVNGREVLDLSAVPKIITTSATEIAVEWPAGPIRVEIAEGKPWQPARVVHEDSEAGEYTSFAVSGKNVRVTNLKPATWYHIRLRARLEHLTAVGPSVAVATKSARPETPENLRIVETLLHRELQDVDLCRGPAAAKHVQDAMIQSRRRRDQHDSALWRLKINWTRPRCNGYSIQRYELQQRDLVREPQHHEAKWTPWRVVHGHLLFAAFDARPPALDSGAVVGARRLLGLRLDEYAPVVPRFVASEFKVKAVNAMGSSDFSRPIRVSHLDCPHSFRPSRTTSPIIEDDDDDDVPVLPRREQPPPVHDECAEVAAALDFPVAPAVIRAAIDSTPVLVPPRKPRHSAARPTTKQSHDDSTFTHATEDRLSPAQRSILERMHASQQHQTSASLPSPTWNPAPISSFA